MSIANSHLDDPTVARRRRTGLIVAGVIVIGGLAFGWPWLVAVGAAPFLLFVLPCVAMCAIGVCMMRGGSKSCAAAAGNAAPVSSSRMTDQATGIERRSSNEPVVAS